MPVSVRKRRKGEGGKAYKIVEKYSGGTRIVGQSTTKLKAQASARVRNTKRKR